jgi:hypothetical protein
MTTEQQSIHVLYCVNLIEKWAAALKESILENPFVEGPHKQARALAVERFADLTQNEIAELRDLVKQDAG